MPYVGIFSSTLCVETKRNFVNQNNSKKFFSSDPSIQFYKENIQRKWTYLTILDNVYDKSTSRTMNCVFQGGTSFVDFLCFFFLSCVCYVFVRVCLYVLCGHLLGKG